jgi:tRNA nucleotidyltransferase (CCA-adding enzyme)
MFRMRLRLPTRLLEVLEGTPELAQAYVVGGSVRDGLLGREVKDFDLEVFGIGYTGLTRALSRWGRVDVVGRSFGVAKLSLKDGEQYDFSLPRRDSKVGTGHRGFEVEFDPAITPESASARRDFTINALMYDPRRDEILDFHGGLADLERRRLRHVGPAFVEDPLRVLRGMQFVGRFDLETDPGTLELCRSMVASHGELAVERVREEWWKWATKSVAPGRGLEFLEATGWLMHYPELASLVGVEQDPEWHPEGDAWKHTRHCVDALVRLPGWIAANEEVRCVLMLAVLLHDVGKATHTRREIRNGRERVVSPGHDAAGGPLAESFLLRMKTPTAAVSRVIPLVLQHMIHLESCTPRSVRRLARRLAPASILELAVVMTADASGRPPRPAGETAFVRELKSMASSMELAESAPRPILLGRHLLARGMVPGPGLSVILNRAFEAQLDGEFSDLAGAERWLDSA